tara:strand:+ start:1553 stop:1741 length:189 start_codon:yes stop_codon:yes gene_type:complete
MIADDIADLYRYFSGESRDYIEIKHQEDAIVIRRRWPLLLDIAQSRPTELKLTSVTESRIRS